MAVMKYMTAIFFIALSMGIPQTAHASSEPDAREVARINNCLPKKVDVYQETLGPEGETVYRVECNMPKTADGSSPGADALLISCQDNLCTLLRPISSEEK